MKLITLNTWGGRVEKPLLNFVEAHKDVDIFCLQEIYHRAPLEKMEKEWLGDSFVIFDKISELLADHKGYFRPVIEDWYGLAIFIKKDIQVSEEGEVSIYESAGYKSGGNHSRNLQYVKFAHEGINFNVINVHGLWNGQGKSDSEHRLEQSRRIRDFVAGREGEIILGGDFNLRPDTESLKMLEESLINLVKKHSITSTRTSLYPKEEKFADYILVSPGVEVRRFEVLPDEVSDHSPLFLEF